MRAIAPDEGGEPAALISQRVPASPVAHVAITEDRGNPVVESQAGRFDEYVSSHLGLVRPVMDQVIAQLKMNLPPAAADTIEQVLSTSCGSRLPFWFGQTFPIVMRELIVNAVESCWRTEGKQLAVDVTLTLENGCLCIEIADRGTGFDPAQKSKLFEEGWSSKQSRLSPCGNGLYYSRRFIGEIMGGSLEIFDGSEIGITPSGALVRIRVPIELERPPEGQ